MKKLLTTTKVEWLKIKGLGLTYLAIILGAFIPLLFFVINPFGRNTVLEDRPPYSMFQVFILENVQAFILCMLLIFMIIAASKIAQLDHKNNCWQLIETQPITKAHIYFSKYIVLLILCFLCIASYFISNFLLSLADFYVHPDPAKILTFDILWALKTFLRMCIAVLGIAALQLCISVVFPGFIWSFLIGILGLCLNLTSVARSENFTFSPYNSLYIFGNSFEVRNLNRFISFSEYLSFFWVIVFLIIGYFWYSGKSFKTAFFKDKKKIVFSVLFLMIGSGIFYFLQKPIAYKADKEGVTIDGELKTTLNIDTIKIYSNDFHKKIASIPVKNNKFSWTTTEKIPFDEYLVEYGGKKIPLIFGSGDWFHLNIECNTSYNKIFLKSNRKADQVYQEDEQFGSAFEKVLNDENASDPQEFYKTAETDWKRNVKKLENFADAENHALSGEYKAYKKQLLAIKYLNEINNYRKITSSTDSKFAPPKEFLDELNENIQKPTYLLSKDDEYLQYKLDQMLDGKKAVSNPDSILFVKLDELPQSLEKDRLLAKHLNENIELQTDSAARYKIFNSQINKIQNKDYRDRLYASFEQINISKKGVPFPNLVLLDDKGKTSELSQYRGKYVVIDLWASWCAPCKKIRPVFETRSYQYRYADNIRFISVSIDQDKTKWANYLKTKPSEVPQYWMPNAEQFMDKYNIQMIPRFVIIDPQGKIFNLNAPFPNEDNFVEILDKLKKY